MAITNHERVGKALELLNAGLKPFVEREMKAVHGDKRAEVARQSFRDDRNAVVGGKVHWDTLRLLVVMWDQWQTVFKNTLGLFGFRHTAFLRKNRHSFATACKST